MTFISVFVGILSIFAQAQQPGEIYQGETAQLVQLKDIANQVKAGDILVIGEVHDREMDHAHQLALIKALVERDFVVNVGMEFLSYTDQDKVNLYMSGQLSEEQFLEQVQWGGTPFSLYKEQMWSGYNSGGEVIALNMPRKVTKDIAKNGLKNISEEHQELMPPNFELGNELYFKRFKQAMGAHGHEEFLLNMFAAQCTWDDTMAWTAVEFMKTRPGEVMIIIVGNFHVIYGGGLPDRIQSRGYNQVQVFTHMGTDEIGDDIQSLLPDPVYGSLGNWIWLSSY